MQKDNQMKLEIYSQSINEAFARGVISAFISQLDPTVDELYDIKMAVSEAVTNAIIHGYELKEDGIVTISSFYYDKTVSISIEDKGKGIPDIEEAMQPLYTTSEEEERAGLGFTVMQEMMDEVKVSSKLGVGTTVTMKKTLAE